MDSHNDLNIPPRSSRDDTVRRTCELLREVKILRASAARLEADRSRLENEMLQRMDQHEEARRALEARVAELEAANQKSLEDFLEMEQQSANLANLFVASDRLHSTLSRSDVITGIEEIIVNLVGSEELAIVEVDESSGRLQISASFGIPAGTYSELPPPAQERIATCLSSRRIWVRDGTARDHDPTACIPLAVDGQVRGAIVIFRLLQQKANVEAVDHELFGVLSTHAAAALYCSSLHAARLQPVM